MLCWPANQCVFQNDTDRGCLLPLASLQPWSSPLPSLPSRLFLMVLQFRRTHRERSQEPRASPRVSKQHAYPIDLCPVPLAPSLALEAMYEGSKVPGGYGHIVEIEFLKGHSEHYGIERTGHQRARGPRSTGVMALRAAVPHPAQRIVNTKAQCRARLCVPGLIM